jgi:hypothetical protein
VHPNPFSSNFRTSPPAEFSLAKQEPSIDFDFYVIKARDKAYAGIYVGNFPDFPKIELLPGETEEVLQAPDFRLRSIWKDKVLVAIEFLMKRTSKLGDSRTFVHAFSVRSADLGVTQQLLYSMRVEGVALGPEPGSN